MARLLVIHHDVTALHQLAKLVQKEHQFMAIDNLLKGVQGIPKIRPDVIVVGHDRKKQEAIRLLRYLRSSGTRIPVIVVFSPDAGSSQPTLVRLGAKNLLEYPVDKDELATAIEEATRDHAETLAGPRPITQEERNSNLSVLENKLNAEMKCFAGRNQVHIQSRVLGVGMKTKPRIALKCSLRAEYSLDPDVYYEFIKDICCGDPERCQAVRQFNVDRQTL